MPTLSKKRVKDKSVRKSILAALRENEGGKELIDLVEMRDIIASTLDGNGVTQRERKDLMFVSKRMRKVTPEARELLKRWLSLCAMQERIPLSFDRLNDAYTGDWGSTVPDGWDNSVYDTGGNGSCAVRVSRALYAIGWRFRRFKGFHWPKDAAKNGQTKLPVNAAQLAKYLDTTNLQRRTIRKNHLARYRQGIIFIDGSVFQNASGHITLWNGNKDSFEDNSWAGNTFDYFRRAGYRADFWDLRPHWIKKKS